MAVHRISNCNARPVYLLANLAPYQVMKLKEELRGALRRAATAEADAKKARQLATNAEVMMSEMTRLYEDNDMLVGRLKQMEVDL